MLTVLQIAWMTVMLQAAVPARPGVPLTLAQARAARVSALRYDLRFVVPASAAEPLAATETIRFELTDVSASLALDFSEPAGRISSLSINGRTTAVVAGDGHVILPAASLRAGANEVRLAFLAGEASLNRNPEFMYTLFVPARAHLAFPCFDQPDLKAKWALTLDVPSGWQALANGGETSRQEAGGRLTLTFAETPPLPTYLFAFAAGRFSVETGERAGRTFRMFHRETDAAKVARNRDTIFDLHAASLAWLERYTGIPYPWGKFDFLLVPSFQFGGMEHAGAIFYNASGLLLDPSATQNQKLSRASVIAHETSHMWFGDLVTMRWFDDVWMKEVFANFMAAKIVNPSFPEINHELRFLYANYPAAYDVDRTPGTNAIRQTLDNLDEAGSLYGAIIYQKAPIVMRQLEGILGEEPFRDGLREYLRGHAFANATWPDLIALLDWRTPEDLEAWSHAWVNEAGRPIIATDLQVADGRITRLAFTQHDPAQARGLTWNQRLQVIVSSSQGMRVLSVRLAGVVTAVPEAIGLPAPDFVLPTGGGIGYGGFVLDEGSVRHLLAHLPEIDDPLTRGAAWVTLWEQMLQGGAAPAAVLDLAMRALPLERDELNVARVLGYTEQAYWKYLEDPVRERVSPDLERVLRAGLDHAATASLKSAWFSALRDTARSRPVLEWLERIWRKTETVPGLTLAEPDYITLALELTVREVPAWQDILDLQLARTENPDRKARFAFVLPALSPDQATRDAFFESLKDPKNRRHEPWVLEALSYLHHPLRAVASEKYIAVSLDMLREIQRTGDIFFPKRWADATMGGHSSLAAARIVDTFITALPPDYPDRLRRVLLSSSDDLLRRAGLRRSEETRPIRPRRTADGADAQQRGHPER
jgi:aminopeptidase N